MRISRLLPLLGAALLVGFAERPPAPAPLSPEAAAKQGRELVEKLLSQQPAENLTNSGVLRIRGERGKRTECPVKFEIVAAPTSWSSVYEAAAGTNGSGGVKLTVIHHDGGPNEYLLRENGRRNILSGNDTMIPFAGSDFWVGDLGLEFFHWPDQRLLKKEIRRSQSCDVLESINPHPAPGAYQRVVSWIDIDSGAIIYAEAYDAQDKLLKEFIPKKVKKVEGQWQLEEMDISNAQTGSRTRIEFDLDRK
jgi:Outer membrane lipoprotein-sorting protein